MSQRRQKNLRMAEPIMEEFKRSVQSLVALNVPFEEANAAEAAMLMFCKVSRQTQLYWMAYARSYGLRKFADEVQDVGPAFTEDERDDHQVHVLENQLSEPPQTPVEKAYKRQILNEAIDEDRSIHQAIKEKPNLGQHAAEEAAAVFGAVDARVRHRKRKGTRRKKKRAS